MQKEQDCTCKNCHANLERLKRVEDWKARLAKENETAKTSVSVQENEGTKESETPKTSTSPSLQLFIGRLPRKKSSTKIHDAIKEAVPAATHVTVVMDKAQKMKVFLSPIFITV
jgi:hypothetical protein